MEEETMKVLKVGQIIFTVAAGLAIAATSGAQGPGVGPGRGPMSRPPMQRAFSAIGADSKGWWNNSRTIEQLKLTDDQRKAMDSILLQHREKLIDLRANLEKAELAMQPLMSADTPNEAATIAQIDKVVQARAELERANSRFLLAIRMKLTVDQWKQIQALQQERREDRWRDRPGMPGPGFRRQPGPNPPPPPMNAPGSGPAPGPGMDE
jgi:Spy/CpxP family protein refolding chaperone